MDTIFATASGQPPAAIAVVRISGSAALSAATAIAGTLPAPRRAGVRLLRDPADGTPLDRALVLQFPGPASATGEDCVEFQLHGGRAVVNAVLRVLAAIPKLRMAAPGEFTRRALLSGRIDLAQAEGLGDLLMAETEAQRRVAIASAEGAVGRAVRGWNDHLIAISAQVEAWLDFSDEDDVAAGGDHAVVPALRALADDLAQVLGAPPTERLRDGVRIVLAGPPNSGKSTLLNRLADRDVAITSPIAGTTRDRIDVPIVRGGMAYVITDTAGLATTTTDVIEAQGIARARVAIAEADMLLWLGDAPPPRADALWLLPRADSRPNDVNDHRIAVSAHHGTGIDTLWQAIHDRSQSMVPREDQVALNVRQQRLCADCLSQVEAAIAASADLLIVAEHLRLARRALDRVTGTSDTEAMLDALFARFCIGK